MEEGSRIVGFLKRFFWIILFIVGVAILLPVAISVVAGFSAGTGASFILSAFALQAAVPPVGIALGLPIWLILVMLACFASGVVLGIIEICRTLGASSVKVAAFIKKVEKKTEKYPIIRKYGAVTCILIAWIPGIGLYGTPVIAWMLGWKRISSVMCTVTGFLIAALFVLFFASRINDILWFAGLAGVIVYAITLSLAMGLALSRSAFINSFRSPFRILFLLIANFILIPLAAFYLAAFLGISAGGSAGLILLSLSAGAASLFIFLQKSGGIMAGTASLVAVLSLITVLYIPIVLPFLIPVQGSDIARVAVCLILLILIPIVTGLYIRPRHEAAAAKWVPWLDKIAWIAFAVVVITLLALFTTAFLEIPGTMSLLASLLFVLISYVVGYFAGGSDPGIRQGYAHVSVQRNLVAALPLTLLVFRDKSLMTMVIVTGILGLVPFFILRSKIRKEEGKASEL